jgi:hypothetical protein
LALFQAGFDLHALRRFDANRYIDAALDIAILEDGKTATIKDAQGLGWKPQHICFAF